MWKLANKKGISFFFFFPRNKILGSSSSPTVMMMITIIKNDDHICVCVSDFFSIEPEPYLVNLFRYYCCRFCCCLLMMIISVIKCGRIHNELFGCFFQLEMIRKKNEKDSFVFGERKNSIWIIDKQQQQWRWIWIRICTAIYE